MTTTRRTVLALAVTVLVSLCALPQAAGAAGATAQPELGPLSPAFVEALHDPLVDARTRAACRARWRSRSARPPRPGPRARRCPPATTCAPEGRLTAVQDQGNWSTCWAFANIAAVESKLISATPAPTRRRTTARTTWSGAAATSRRSRPAVRPGRLRLHGHRLLRAVGRAGRRGLGPLRRRGRRQRHRQARAGRRHDPRPRRSPRQRRHQATRDRQRRAQRRHGLGLRVHGRLRRTRTSTPTPRARTTASASSAGTTTTPRPTSAPSGQAPAGDGAFLVRNSWGDGLGRRRLLLGLLLRRVVRRGAGPRRLRRHVVLLRRRGHRPTTPREYQYDKLGVTAHTGYGSTRVWGANRFTAAADQTIAAAVFYTLSAGTQYQVWAGRSLRSLKLRAIRHGGPAGVRHRAARQHAARSTRASRSWSPSGSTRRARDTRWRSSTRARRSDVRRRRPGRDRAS